MTTPLVSICLPNLNTRPFLQERIDTILAQTCDNWELIVSDNHSDDGAWAFFEDLARRDPRVSIAQAPREGLYPNWNRCIARARGELVYIATSDDTMAPDCLEKLVSALEAHPEADIAHCRLRTIDEHGESLPNEWWLQGSAFAESSGPLMDLPHLRRAPFDGLLHLLGGSVYVSITQLLIRRSLFSRIGLFEPAWGSLGDFNWNMRAGLVANTIHVPDTWGGWRCHQAQATASAGVGSSGYAEKIDAMISHAVSSVRHQLTPRLRMRLEHQWLPDAAALRSFQREVERYQPPAREAFVLWRTLTGSRAARYHTESSLLRRPLTDRIVRWLEDEGISPVLIPTSVGSRRTGAGSALRGVQGHA